MTLKPIYLSIYLSQPKLNHNSTQPKITKVGFDMKMTSHHHPPPQTHCQQYLRCSRPNFNQTLKVGFWNQQQPHYYQQQEQQQQKQHFIYY